VTHDYSQTFHNLYSTPAIEIPWCSGESIFQYQSDTISFKYNKQGYRSQEFDSIRDDFMLVAGCSHSEGHGLHIEQTWCHKVSASLRLDLVNLAKGSSGADFLAQNVFNWLSTGKLPKLIIAQWPNPFRFMQWEDHVPKFILSGTPTAVYEARLKHDEFGFWTQWLNHIIFVDQICHRHRVPVVHVCFEEKQFVEHTLDILEHYHIKLHVDEKIPGNTWHFDSQAADLFHHSATCHSKWADRILTLVANHLKYTAQGDFHGQS